MSNENEKKILDSAVRILIEKGAGEREFHSEVVAPDAVSVLAGICFIIEEFSQLTGIPVQGVVARLAVVLLTEKPQELTAEPEQ